MRWRLADGRRRRQADRGRITRGLLKVLALACALGLSAGYGYQVGIGLSGEEFSILEREVGRLTAEVKAIEPARVAAEERIRQFELALEGERARYRRDVPAAAEAELIQLLRKRSDDGVPLARLRTLIAAAPLEERCEPAPESRRFPLATPDFPQVGGVGRFASGTITVTGAGRSARDEAGRLQAWFDPAAPVTLKFARPGGLLSEATGALPLYHVVVVGDQAWRFAAVPGTRSFVEMTAERCAYP